MAETEGYQSKYSEVGVYNNPKKKGSVDEEYIRRKGEYIFSNYVRGTSETSWASQGKFSLLRKYLDGMQDEGFYKKQFFGEETGSTQINGLGIDIGGVSSGRFDSETFARKAMSHINWKVMSPMPKIVNKVLSSYYGSMYDINIECVDENSISEQDKAKWDAWGESQADYIGFRQEMQRVTGLPYEPLKNRIETISELELHESNGDFKLSYAKEGEKLIKDAWNISNEDEVIEKTIKDLLSCNIAGFRVIYDREIGKEVIRYVDVENAVCQSSNYHDFRDSSYAGEVILVPAFQLQSYGIDPKTLPAVAKQYANMYGNPSWEDKYEHNLNTEDDLACGFFQVPVLDFEFIEVETIDQYVLYETKYGTKQSRKYKEGESLSANKQYESTELHTVYQGKWVIDTDIVYDWGKKPNQPKRNKNQAVLSFHFIKGKTAQSLVEQLIPILDDFQFTWIRFQDAKASAVKSGLAIEWSSMMGMNMGGNELSPFDILSIYRTTGDMFYRRNQRHTGISQANPITPLQNSTSQLINDLAAALDMNAKLVEDLTGINPVALGSTADPRAGKAVTEMAVSSSAAPIKNIFDKVFQLKAHASLDILQRAQLDMRNSKTVSARYKSVLGEFGVQTLILAEGKGVAFGTKLVARPTPEKINKMQEFIGIALQSGKNGIPLLTIPEAMYLTRRIEEGAPWREIELYLQYTENKKTEEQQAYAQANAQQQAQQAQMLQQIKAQEAQQMSELDARKQVIINNNKFNNDAQLENLRSSNKREEIKTEGTVGARVR